MLVIRDTRSNATIEGRPVPSLLDRVTYPIASVYNNLVNMQDISNDIRLEQAKDWFEGDMDVIEIAYDSEANTENESEIERASLSWHLTAKEKQNIIEDINIPSNKEALQELRDLLEGSGVDN